MYDLLANSAIGMIFFVPGVSETLRLVGHASVVSDAGLLSDMVVRGQASKLGIRIDIAYVFFHCAKALLRSKLWDPAIQIREI